MLNRSKNALVISVFAISLVGMATGAVAQEAAPARTPNPVIHADKAQIRADHATTRADRRQKHADVADLRADKKTGNTAEIPADKAAI